MELVGEYKQTENDNNQKKPTRQYAEEKRLVFSFVLRKESEGMPDTERRMFQTTGPMY